MKKYLRLTQIFLLLLFFQSCVSKINYLGSYYEPTKDVELFFEVNDIEKKYKVIGLMNRENGLAITDDIEEIKKAMLDKAKSVGADAILVTRFGNQITQKLSEDTLTKKVVTEESSKMIVEAKFLKYH